MLRGGGRRRDVESGDGNKDGVLGRKHQAAAACDRTLARVSMLIADDVPGASPEPPRFSPGPGAHRIIFQIVATGSRVVGRAFAEAYRQANASSKYKAVHSANSHFADRRAGLSVDEACRILNVKTPNGSGKLTGLTMDEVAAQYKRLFDANDPAKGGSFYLQSKVVRAQERLQAQLGKIEAEAEEARAATEGFQVYKEKPPS
ncbi:hypothetical protein ABW21_db0204349 [Orbilia brochopaga]|nr:hypothetical protein ABW21_db0204349 [Drechslerella brochopaga]